MPYIVAHEQRVSSLYIYVFILRLSEALWALVIILTVEKTWIIVLWIRAFKFASFKSKFSGVRVSALLAESTTVLYTIWSQHLTHKWYFFVQVSHYLLLLWNRMNLKLIYWSIFAWNCWCFVIFLSLQSITNIISVSDVKVSNITGFRHVLILCVEIIFFLCLHTLK